VTGAPDGCVTPLVTNKLITAMSDPRMYSRGGARREREIAEQERSDIFQSGNYGNRFDSAVS